MLLIVQLATARRAAAGARLSMWTTPAGQPAIGMSVGIPRLVPTICFPLCTLCLRVLCVSDQPHLVPPKRGAEGILELLQVGFRQVIDAGRAFTSAAGGELAA